VLKCFLVWRKGAQKKCIFQTKWYFCLSKIALRGHFEARNMQNGIHIPENRPGRGVAVVEKASKNGRKIAGKRVPRNGKMRELCRRIAKKPE
jgi:hypothetical protein